MPNALFFHEPPCTANVTVAVSLETNRRQGFLASAAGCYALTSTAFRECDARVLAIFDLDNTLIAGDSDYLWGEYLGERGAVDRRQYDRLNAGYLKQYQEGTLDINEFLRFSLKPLAESAWTNLYRWRMDFLAKKIVPILLPKAQELIEIHRRQQHQLLIITSTNRFVTEPIADRLGIPHLIATEPEFLNGQYTGRVVGTPSFAAGKVTRLFAWLSDRKLEPEEIWCYSDSHNDVALLESATRPVAVDPDPVLQREALTRGWPILSLRS